MTIRQKRKKKEKLVDPNNYDKTVSAVICSNKFQNWQEGMLARAAAFEATPEGAEAMRRVRECQEEDRKYLLRHYGIR